MARVRPPTPQARRSPAPGTAGSAHPLHWPGWGGVGACLEMRGARIEGLRGTRGVGVGEACLPPEPQTPVAVVVCSSGEGRS